MRSTIVVEGIVMLSLVTSLCSKMSYGQYGNTFVLSNKSYYEEKYQDNAFSILVPEEWNFKGNIQFGPAPLLTYDVNYEITNEQSNSGINVVAIGQRYIWPTPAAGPVGQLMYSMQGQLYYGSIVHPILTPNEFYYNFIYPENVKKYQNFQIKEISTNPSKAQTLYQSALRDPVIGALISYGLAQVSYEVIEIEFEFTIGGHPIEAYFEGVFEYVLNQRGFMTWGMSGGYSLYAVRGDLKHYDALFRMIINSFIFNTSWQIKVERHRSQLQNIALDVQEYARKMNESAQINREAMMDRWMTDYSETLRGISEYEDPFYGEPKWLPNTYDNIWMNTNGDVILTDQVMNPNEMSQYNSREWRMVKKQ